MKAKADKTHRFWGLYVHACKTGTLTESYQMVKRNNGAPGIDGMTFNDKKIWSMVLINPPATGSKRYQKQMGKPES